MNSPTQLPLIVRGQPVGELISMREAVELMRVACKALAAGALVIAGLRAGAGTIGPVFLALVLTVAVHPAHAWTRRHRR